MWREFKTIKKYRFNYILQPWNGKITTDKNGKYEMIWFIECRVCNLNIRTFQQIYLESLTLESWVKDVTIF